MVFSYWALSVALALAANEPYKLARGGVQSTSEVQRFGFQRVVANLEYATAELERERARGDNAIPPLQSGNAWSGIILRRLVQDGPLESRNSVRFVAEYAGGSPSRVWCDSNMNGDLADDPFLTLFNYPSGAGARSFLVDLHWDAHRGDRRFEISWTVRVVLEREGEGGVAPRYRVQMVYAMTGTVVLGGKTHQAVLYDGSGDGLYSIGFYDGVFIDLNDDHHFEVDEMSKEYAPFAAEFVMEERVYEVVSVDPEGKEIALLEKGAARGYGSPPAVGRAAPDFSYVDLTGEKIHLEEYRGRVILVYFWASWCGDCRHEADEIKLLHDQYHGAGMEIIGVSYDIDRQALESFRKRHGHTWPTSFSGLTFGDDPVGRLYQARAAGMIYLVGSDGVLEGIYGDLKEVASRLDVLLPKSSNVGSR